MLNTTELLEILKDSTDPGSTRRPVGKTLIDTRVPLSAKNISELTGYTNAVIHSCIARLRVVFAVETILVGKVQHHIIRAKDQEPEGVNVPKLLRDAFSPTDTSYLPNGYYKGTGFGSMQL